MMNVDEADHFLTEDLAKWLKVTREYLFGPMPGAGSSRDAVSLLPEGKRFSPSLRSAPVRWTEIAEETLPHPASQTHSTRAVLLSWAFRALLHLLRRATQDEKAPLAALESAFYFHVSFMAKHPTVSRTILARYSQTRDVRVRARIEAAIGHYESRLARLFCKAKHQGLVRSTVDVETAASVFVGMIQGLMLRMNADLIRPGMLLRDAATTFPVYLDGICVAPAPVRGAAFS
ncbi:MAG: hypothetical protein A3H93_06675 [Rhodocyclales bacterium RIFCSPLOWO2_02_FULL_63_24]|nr:MAG: hypothetical protein A3H93_06675 [Rhodocyclales bacterium RIFCSPLOWO2_02_FULL_63_24]